MFNLQKAVELLLRHSRLPPLGQPESLEPSNSMQYADTECRSHANPPQSLTEVSPAAASVDGSSQGTFTAEGPDAGMHLHDDDSDLVPLPMNNLYNLTDPTKSSLIRVDPSDVNGPDLIDQGVLPLTEAEYLFDFYRDHINPLLLDGMLCSHKTLGQARSSSSFLVTVVLTVAALHIPEREACLHATYGAFVSLMRRSCLLRCQNLDIVRALCIGAFYLTSLSWALCSRAVRVATEMNLHKSSLQFARGSHQESYERVRLWYALYVCDHQFALAYGRPPLMHEDAAIRNAEKLLTSELSSWGDKGLVGQVKLFRILSSIWLMYGCDPDLELSGHDFEKLRSFNLALDQWRLDHQSSDSGSSARENLALPRGNMLYYHLARFQLNSVALRGISGREESSDTPGLRTNWERQEAANNAIVAAMSTARLIIDDEPLQSGLIGLPIFVHAMVAVCASFLLKMAVVFAQTPPSSSSARDKPLRLPNDLAQYGLAFHTRTALASVGQLVVVLVHVADNASQGHVARQVVNGLKELLQRFEESPRQSGFVYSQPRPCQRGAGHQMSADEGSALGVPVPAVERLGIGVTGVESANEGVLAMQDPFDLTGDLDWRFDGSFLWGIDGIDVTGGFA
ncbi:uncharacterized protein N0V89_008467 [Didymosphaeria variabile]|uniref:Xylanolytic transcriptional activator regulatory domain-containing protein n=1 Tax=Didymosphaeria variabile TaxID=1932322 RepID=A0A9W8XG98_9PLEO|nr:uncharacterized protein N0V89_008467 [Didymosphaeria variabile]KAJ4349848.1 hypothetical protein N0V89_008467 [Didymosphaeria variabile]